jgi:hypothetical protein
MYDNVARQLLILLSTILKYQHRTMRFHYRAHTVIDSITSIFIKIELNKSNACIISHTTNIWSGIHIYIECISGILFDRN